MWEYWSKVYFFDHLYLLFFPPSPAGEREEPRRSRLAQLCTYLQERYKHLCRQERAATRHTRYKYVFRKALLHAASKDPDCTGELIQELSKTSQNSSRYRNCWGGVCISKNRIRRVWNCMIEDVSCFLGTQYIGSWKNLCVLLTPRVKPAATRLYLLHTTASNVSFCHVTNDLFHICGFSSGIPAVIWLCSDVIFTLWTCILVSFWSPWQCCFVDILLNRSQQLFSSCTARFADGQQCSVPVFDITHQTPLCDEHAKKMVSKCFIRFFYYLVNFCICFLIIYTYLYSSWS